VYSLSLPLCGHGAFRCGVLFEYIPQLEVLVGSQVSHVLFCCFCLWFETGPCCVVCVLGVVFLFFVAPFSLLAVFSGASAFNQDVSTWSTGAVTRMDYSKCTLSLPLCWPRRLPLWCVVEYIYQLEVLVGSQVSHVLFCCFCLWFETVPFLLLFVWWVWSFFFFVAPFLFL
jgi:surface protein